MSKKSIPRNNCLVATCDQLALRTVPPFYCTSHLRRFELYGDPLFSYSRCKNDSEADWFWKRTNKAGKGECWEWHGGAIRCGYGMMRYEGRSRMATHISWHIKYGVFPTLDLLHSCDNPPCVNPNHLREGTHAENMREAAERNRTARGVRSGRAKLTPDAVRDIRSKLGTMSERKIAKLHNVSHTVIQYIRVGRTWSHVV